MFNLVGVLLERFFPASALMAKGRGYVLLRGGWVIPHGITTLQKEKRGEWERNPFKPSKKKIWQYQAGYRAGFPLYLNLFEGQSVLGVVTRDSNKFLNLETAGGFMEG